jgi:hypothetical protein
MADPKTHEHTCGTSQQPEVGCAQVSDLTGDSLRSQRMKLALSGGIGSAAIVAAALYVGRRRTEPHS